jgi:SAM-dependent methyltransferase
MSTHHTEFYRQALYYDIAFGYRDVHQETDFLEACYQRQLGRPARSMVELACGPGYHTLEFARRGYRAVGLDLQPEMVSYLVQKAGHAGLTVEGIVADMRDFELAQPVDLACNLLTSISYLLSNEDVVAHLRSVARNLTEGGVYIIEANHPRDYFSGIQFRPVTWTMERDGVCVEASWGGNAHVNVANEQYEIEACYHVHDHGQEVQVRDAASLRLMLPQELRALIELSGAFVPIGWYGDFSFEQPLDDSERSWRTIVALQKAPA